MLKADTQIKLLKIDVTDKNLYKPRENNDIGMGAKLCFYLQKFTQNQRKHFKIISGWCKQNFVRIS